MSCDVGKATEGWRMSCDVGEATKRLENELCSPSSQLCSFSKLTVTSPRSQLILQPFCRFTYVTAHSRTLLLLHLRHSSFSMFRFSYATSSSLNSPGEPPMFLTIQVSILQVDTSVNSHSYYDINIAF